MNILYLNNSLHLGGDNRCIMTLCKEFKKNNNIIMASDGGVCESHFKELGIKHYKINDVADKSILNIIRICLDIRKISKENNIDIIHSHHRMTTLLAKAATKFTNIKIIHTQHSCVSDKLKFTKLALRKTNVIAVGNEVKKILVNKSKLKSENIKVIYNSVELDRKEEAADSRLIDMSKNGYFVVTQVSRVDKNKGVYDFVDIAEKVIKGNKNIMFTIIGDGPEKDNLQKYIISKQIEKNVMLLGRKEDILGNLKYVNLMLLCSYVEGLPLVPLEAFSQKIPVIGTNIGGTNEEIENGENGYLIDVKDIDGFCEKILKLYNNKELLESMGQKAFKIYLNNFNQKKYIKSHNDIYQELHAIK